MRDNAVMKDGGRGSRGGVWRCKIQRSRTWLSLGVTVLICLVLGLSLGLYLAPSNSAHETGGEPLGYPRAGELADVDQIYRALQDGALVVDASANPPLLIQGAVSIPSRSLVDEDRQLRSVPELARVLGEKGISETDDVIVYGCTSCGDDTFLFWALRYLGHEKVRLMDGGIEDWIAAGYPTSEEAATLFATVYRPAPVPGLLASYGDVASGRYQVIDARSAEEYGEGHVPGSLNLEADLLMAGRHLAGPEELYAAFSGLEKDEPLAVYSKNGGKASVVWYALVLMGYDARLYTWNDWQSQGGPRETGSPQIIS